MLLKTVVLAMVAMASATNYAITLESVSLGGPDYQCHKLTATRRTCYCVKNIKTGVIGDLMYQEGGDIKVFSSTDCTGAFDTVPSGGGINNAYWVNSVSFGPSGSSVGPNGCPAASSISECT